ncbi:TraR/DksA C4-type zinc finger protein [Enterobacter sp. JJBC]|uniref:TraR/DksA C4-type zinc finger protein n=1 Tax=Enterobacter sp. JJBC TaxID=3080020 RepID=UPI0030D4C325
MSDDLNDEMAQASTAVFTQRGIDAIRAKVHSSRPSKETCECCGADIPVARQLAVPGVALCAGCQDVEEKQSVHRASGNRGRRHV